MTDPVQPVATPPPPPTAPAAEESAPVTSSPNPDQSAATDEGSEARAADSVVAEIDHGESPIKEQRIDPRFQDRPEPLEIIYLTGAYKGMAQDIGIAVNGEKHTQYAEWGTREESNVRTGLNFKGISNREITFTLEFYSSEHDVSHLAENCAHLQEITDGESEPPKLMLVRGKTQIAPVVCTNYDLDLQEPFSGKKGYMRATVNLSMRLDGGRESPHALAPPLAATPLADIRARQTAAERAREGEQAVVQQLLAGCVGQEGSEQLSELIDNNQLGNVDQIAQLEANTFVQSAIAGLIPQSALDDPRIQEKLAIDLAAVMARNENGVGNTINADAFADSLISGNPGGLPPELAEQLPATRADYSATLEAIRTQDLGADAEIFADGSTAGERLRSNFGNCGLQLRQVGAGSLSQGQAGSDAETLASLNDFLASASDQEISDRLGLESSQQVATLKDGVPYQSKQEFVEFTAGGTDTVGGYVLWGNFLGSQSNENAEPETPET
jgi:hypothetical protein